MFTVIYSNLSVREPTKLRRRLDCPECSLSWPSAGHYRQQGHCWHTGSPGASFPPPPQYIYWKQTDSVEVDAAGNCSCLALTVAP